MHLEPGKAIIQSRIGRRLITAIVLVSSIITLFITVVDLRKEYHREINQVNQSFQQIQSTHLPAIVTSVWSFDAIQAEHNLEGILKFPHVIYTSIKIDGRLKWSKGQQPSKNVIQQSFSLLTTYRGKQVEIGELEIFASKEKIYLKLWDKALFIIVANGLKTFIVAAFILLIVYLFLTRHMVRIVAHLSKHDFSRSVEPLRLKRQKNKNSSADELDEIVDSINEMNARLALSHQTLKDNEYRYELAVRGSSDGIWDWCIESGATYLSPRGAELLGYQESDDFTQHIDNISTRIHPDDQTLASQVMADHIKNNEPYRIELRLRNKQGDYAWFLIRGQAVRDEQGIAVRMAGSISDISERKKLEESITGIAAAVSAKVGAEFFTHLVVDLAKLIDVDVVLIGLLDEQNTDLINTLALFAHGKVVDNISYSLVDSPCANAVEKGGCAYQSGVQELFPKDKSLREMGINGYCGKPLYNGGGSPIGLLSVLSKRPMYNIEKIKEILSIFTARLGAELERVKAEKEVINHRDNLERLVAVRTADLLNATQAAESANQAKSIFLSRMSHELRTPLNAILGFSQLLETDPNEHLSNVQQGNIDEILRAGRHLASLIGEILDLAKIENGKLTVAKDFVALDIVASCLNLLKPQALERRIEINDCVSGRDYMLQADKLRLKQVLLNLLSNAIKYNKTGGSITVTAEKVDCETGKDQCIRISVSDTGQGIVKNKLKSLFIPFERLGEKDDVEGAGIGLAISKELVELMGGSIGVQSTPNQGSCFWIELRDAEQKANGEKIISIGNHSDTNTRKSSDEKPKKVLYVENDPVNLKLVEQIFSLRPDIKFLAATAVLPGLEIVAEQQPDLILLDINLSGMDGYAMLRRLQTQRSSCDIPVIAVSANAMPNEIKKGLAAGFIDYLTKPFVVNDLLSIVDSVLQSGSSKNQCKN